MLKPYRILQRICSVHHRAVGSLSSLAAGSGHLKLDEKIEDGDVWDSLRLLCKKREWKMVMHLLDVQELHCTSFNRVKGYKYVLQECAEVEALAEGKQIHAHMKENKLDHVKKLNKILLRLYVKCRDMEAAQEVFNTISQKDIDTWTLLIGGCVKGGLVDSAFELFWRMESEGVKPNGVTCVCMIKACTGLLLVMMVHDYVISLGLHLNVFVGNTLLDMYFKCGTFEDAFSVFTQMPASSDISWNRLIAGHAQFGFLEKAFELFQAMRLKGSMPNEVTFVSILKAGTHSLDLLKRLHAEIIQNGFASNAHIASALIDGYAVFGKTTYARKVFEAVPSRDSPLWNSMLFCYAECGDAVETLSLFLEMSEEKVVPDNVTFLSLLKACTGLQNLTVGRKIHARIIHSGFEKLGFVGSALVDMYAKCGHLEDAQHVFGGMPKQDLVSWNALIAGYTNREPAMEAFDLFHKMKRDGVKPDRVAFLTILKACANFGAFTQGLDTHMCILDDGLHDDVFLCNTLIDMYGKCGSLSRARKVFDTMRKRDVFSWSAMIVGYAQHGRADDAFTLFSEMQRENVSMDDVTFVGVLTACSHAGLVNRGCEYFDAMKNRYGIMPTSETCACIVDLFGRAGQLQEAVWFIKGVDMDPTSSMWMALLNACTLAGDLDLAEQASKRIRMIDPQRTQAFVLLSNAYIIAE